MSEAESHCPGWSLSVAWNMNQPQSHLCPVSPSRAALQVWDVCAQGARGAGDRRSLGHLEPLRDLLEDLRRRHKDGDPGVQQARVSDWGELTEGEKLCALAGPSPCGTKDRGLCPGDGWLCPAWVRQDLVIGVWVKCSKKRSLQG